MQLKKIIDKDHIQGYHVINPSKTYLESFPEKYLLVDEYGIIMSDYIPEDFTIGYLFSIDGTVKLKHEGNEPKYNPLVGSVFPRCLDEFFDDGHDIILSVIAKHKVFPPALTEEIIIRASSDRLMGNVKKYVLKTVNDYIERKHISVEDWIREIVDYVPTNCCNLPVKYPKLITNDNINTFKIDTKNIFLEYDFRANSYEHENKFIRELEETFEDPDFTVYIGNTFNNIQDVIKKKLDEKNIKYSTVIDGYLGVKLKHLRDLDIEYDLTDFL